MRLVRKSIRWRFYPFLLGLIIGAIILLFDFFFVEKSFYCGETFIKSLDSIGLHENEYEKVKEILGNPSREESSQKGITYLYEVYNCEENKRIGTYSFYVKNGVIDKEIWVYFDYPVFEFNRSVISHKKGSNILKDYKQYCHEEFRDNLNSFEESESNFLKIKEKLGSASRNQNYKIGSSHMYDIYDCENKSRVGTYVFLVNKEGIIRKETWFYLNDDTLNINRDFTNEKEK